MRKLLSMCLALALVFPVLSACDKEDKDESVTLNTPPAEEQPENPNNPNNNGEEDNQPEEAKPLTIDFAQPGQEISLQLYPEESKAIPLENLKGDVLLEWETPNIGEASYDKENNTLNVKGVAKGEADLEIKGSKNPKTFSNPIILHLEVLEEGQIKDITLANELLLMSQGLLMKLNTQSVVKVEEGSGSYEATFTNEDGKANEELVIAVDGPKIRILAKVAGTYTVTITDTKSSKAKDFIVRVSAPSSIIFSPESAELTVGDPALTVTIAGGELEGTLKASSMGVAVLQKSATEFTIKGDMVGSGIITVKIKDGQDEFYAYNVKPQAVEEGETYITMGDKILLFKEHKLPEHVVFPDDKDYELQKRIFDYSYNHPAGFTHDERAAIKDIDFGGVRWIVGSPCWDLRGLEEVTFRNIKTLGIPIYPTSAPVIEEQRYLKPESTFFACKKLKRVNCYMTEDELKASGLKILVNVFVEETVKFNGKDETLYTPAWGSDEDNEEAWYGTSPIFSGCEGIELHCPAGTRDIYVDYFKGLFYPKDESLWAAGITVDHEGNPLMDKDGNPFTFKGHCPEITSIVDDL